MGRRGPTPTPTKVKQLRGETRPSRLNLREPMPSPDVPKMPADMDAEAKVVWRRVAARHAPHGRHPGRRRGRPALLLRGASRRYAHAVRLLRAVGPAGPWTDGHLVKNPLHQIVRDNRDAIRLFARELGLSPSARVGPADRA